MAPATILPVSCQLFPWQRAPGVALGKPSSSAVVCEFRWESRSANSRLASLFSRVLQKIVISCLGSRQGLVRGRVAGVGADGTENASFLLWQPTYC